MTTSELSKKLKFRQINAARYDGLKGGRHVTTVRDLRAFLEILPDDMPVKVMHDRLNHVQGVQNPMYGTRTVATHVHGNLEVVEGLEYLVVE